MNIETDRLRIYTASCTEMQELIHAQIVKLLGKGKGGYSYLVTDGNAQYVLKQIHHEPLIMNATPICGNGILSIGE